MTLQEIEALHERCLSGIATPEEQALFEQYKDQFDLADIPWANDMGNREKVGNKLKKDLDRMIKRRETSRSNRYYWAAAASVLLAAGIYLFFLKERKEIKPVNQISYMQPVIRPAGNKALLILANSKTITLDSSKLGNVAAQSNMAIVKSQKHLLEYRTNNAAVADKATEFNTLITPRGGKYELQLADGTKVWLNADSRLRFPVSFTGKERVVELTGEAYFEVTKNKNMPFKVVTGSKTVEVLGTHFDVSAYPNDTYCTTLLEGSVKLNATGGASALLRPGEHGVFNAENRFEVAGADTASAVAWKNGIFLFRNEGITDIMKQISRWYDVDVDYKGNVPHVKLGGTVSRYANITNLLNTIELTGSVHFKIEGRRVIVMQ